MTDPACLALEHAERECVRLGSRLLSAAHLLLGIIDVPGDFGKSIIADLADLRDLRAAIEELVPSSCEKELDLSASSEPSYDQALRYAFEEEDDCTFVGTEHLLIGVLRAADVSLSTALRNAGVSLEAVRRGLQTARTANATNVKCENCGALATVHLTEADAGVSNTVGVTTRHYCISCASKREV